jgi:MarR family transcriptional regulator, organic hydroperoxide resistance regulator
MEGGVLATINETIGFLLAQVCRAHRNTANEVLSEAGLHVGQEMVLLRLWEQDGLRQSELAEQLCVEAPTVTRMLQRMERADLVERQPDPEDARVSRVYVTPQGAALQEAVQEAWARLEAQMLRGLTLEEKLLLRRLLMQLQQNLTM